MRRHRRDSGNHRAFQRKLLKVQQDRERPSLTKRLFFEIGTRPRPESTSIKENRLCIYYTLVKNPR